MGATRRPFSGGPWLDSDLVIPGHTLVFQDEFNSGSAPDYGNGTGGSSGTYYPAWTWDGGPATTADRLWGPSQTYDMRENAALLEGDTATSGRAGYSSSLATISGGKLHLNAVNSTQRYGGQNFPHGTSLIRKRQAYLFGIFEAKISVPSGQGCWPAFWLMPSEFDDGAVWEVDVFEFLNNEPSTKARLNCHWGSGYGGPGHHQSQSDANGDWTGEHTYRLIWTPTSYEWVFDGVTVKTFADGVDGDVNPDVPMQPIINLNVGGSWPGGSDGTTPWPLDMTVDYLRIWQES
jgi:beta-glucanase (GH16 family)